MATHSKEWEVGQVVDVVLEQSEYGVKYRKGLYPWKGSEVGLSKRPVAMVIGAGKDLIGTVEVFSAVH